MPLIDPESQPVKKEQLNVRIDPTVAATLRSYCEFLRDSSQHHVVEELLRYGFARDKEFQSWQEQHKPSRDESASKAGS